MEFNSSKSLLINESSMQSGYTDSTRVIYSGQDVVGIPNCDPMISSQNWSSQPLIGEHYSGLAKSERSSSFNGMSSLNDGIWNEEKVDPIDKLQLEGKRKRAAQLAPVTGHWRPEEDRKLISLVKEYGENYRWSQIADMLGGRSGKQCRERWMNNLNPSIKTGEFTPEEERVLVAGHQEFGSKWTTILKRMPGRTENKIKSHFNASKRRMLKPGSEPSTYLDNYMRSCVLNSSNADSPDSQSTCLIPETHGASTELKQEDLTGPEDDVYVPVPICVEEKELSEEKRLTSILSGTPNNLAVKSDRSALN